MIHKMAFARSLTILIAALVSQACERPGQTRATPRGMGALLGETTQGYRQVLEGEALRFPEDHHSHDDFRQEWWYLTANLTTESGEQLGVQWTQFRVALSPDGRDSSTWKHQGWQTRQLYMAHTAVTSENSHSAAEKWSRGHGQLAGTRSRPFSVSLDDWSWQSETGELFPATLSADTGDIRYRLTLSSQAPFQLQGNAGYSVKSADKRVASYYYSQPFIRVAGEINRGGHIHRVTGQAWLDREWSSQFLTETQQGWDWFALRLDDGSALMVFQLRGEPNFYSARRMYRDGLGVSIDSDEIVITQESWHEIAGKPYPVGWRIQIPSQQIDIRTQALNPDAKMPLSIPYWEGPIRFDGSHSGQGYMELTGY